jgi:hypothetical protein
MRQWSKLLKRWRLMKRWNLFLPTSRSTIAGHLRRNCGSVSEFGWVTSLSTHLYRSTHVRRWYPCISNPGCNWDGRRSTLDPSQRANARLIASLRKDETVLGQPLKTLLSVSGSTGCSPVVSADNALVEVGIEVCHRRACCWSDWETSHRVARAEADSRAGFAIGQDIVISARAATNPQHVQNASATDASSPRFVCRRW